MLSILIWLPIFGGAVLLVIGDDGDASRASRHDALVALRSLLTFVLSIGLVHGFDNAAPACSLSNAHRGSSAQRFYYLGVDGISAPLILLTTFITPLVVIAGWESSRYGRRSTSPRS